MLSTVALASLLAVGQVDLKNCRTPDGTISSTQATELRCPPSHELVVLPRVDLIDLWQDRITLGITLELETVLQESVKIAERRTEHALELAGTSETRAQEAESREAILRDARASESVWGNPWFTAALGLVAGIGVGIGLAL